MLAFAGMLAIPRSAVHLFAAACAATTLGASGLSAKAQPAVFTAGPGAMAVVTIPMADACAASGPQDATAFGVWVDGRYEQEIVVYPGSGRTQYDALLGPFPAGRHRVELRPSSFWRPGGCVRPGRPLVTLKTAITLDGSAIIKNAPHPNAAKLFLDFTVSKEMQQVMVDQFGRRSVRRDVGSPAGLPPLDKIKAIDYDLGYAANNRAELLKRFQDALIKTQ